MIISQSDVFGVLEPHIPTIRECVHAGLDDFNVNYDSERFRLSARSRASVIRDLIFFHVRRLFEGVKGVKILQKETFEGLLVEQRILLRIKKLNNKKQASNLPTRQALDFSNQQLCFEGFLPPIACLNLGYIPDKAWVCAEEIVIACPNSMKTNAWYIDITEDKYVEKAPVFPIVEGKVSNTVPRVRAKSQIKRSNTGTEGSK